MAQDLNSTLELPPMSEEELRRLEGRWKSDMDLKVDRVDGRVRTIERLVWIATGGVSVLAVASTMGLSVLYNFSGRMDSFSTRLEVVSIAQAVSISEFRLNEEQAKHRIEELQKQVEKLNGRK